MIALYITNFILIGLVSLVALAIMLYWNHATGGRLKPRGGSWQPVGGWREHPSGRSLMGLLAILFFITFNAAVQGMVPAPIHVKAFFYFALYLVLIYALVRIGLVIRAEVRRGRRHSQKLPETGDITIITKLSKEQSREH